MLITNIQRSSFHDGPGIRTTVFLKGCMLHCPWCANPETIAKAPEVFYDESLCVRQNNTCVCNTDCSIVTNKPIRAVQCPAHAISVFGTYYSNDDLYTILMKDNIYYETGGGVTFSGGEPFLQLHSAINLLERLKSMRIHLCVETSLFTPSEYFEAVCNYFDLFYVDLKVLTKDMCKKLLGGDIELFFSNLETLFSMTNKVIFRIPLVLSTTTEENISAISNIIKEYKPIKVEYFDVHSMAEKKYKLLNKRIPVFEKVPDVIVNRIKNILLTYRIESEYLKI
jgi:pyruvate formate lyase activating enzyme